MEQFAFFMSDLLDLLGEKVDYLLSLSPQRFVRVFWALVFLEIPRYLLTDVYVLFRLLVSKEPARPFEHVAAEPLVSAILPALNEEQTIGYAVRSLLDQDYTNMEIIVVDDGSTDRTPEICQELADAGLIRFLKLRSRQGKSAALNYGLKASRGEYIVFMDTDSTFDRGSIRNILKYFQNERVGAVSGNLGVRNRDTNLLTRLQAIEYLVSITVGRFFRASIDILTIVPGAFGAFRRDLLQPIGGHEPGPGNDSDLTIRTRKLRKRVAFAPDATCLTNVPESVKRWIRQRMRWYRNIVRNRLRRHKDIYNVFQASFRLSNLFAFVDTIFFAVILTLVWLVYIVEMAIHYPDLYGLILFANICFHMAIKFIQFLIALTISDRRSEYVGLIFYVPVFSLYRIVQRVVRTAAVLQELLFRWSYRDPFAPEKVRREMEVY